jgi:anthranilate synthase component 1
MNRRNIESHRAGRFLRYAPSVLAPIAEELDEAAFRRRTHRADLIPVVRELVADTLTPVGAYLRLARKGVPGFLLESAEGGERWGRYSVLGVDPRATLTYEDGGWTRREGSRTERLPDGLAGLRAELARSKAMAGSLPRFAGGLFGYFGYDVVRWFERIPDRHGEQRSKDFPDALFFRIEDAVVFDNARQRAVLVAWADVRRARSPRAAFHDAQARLDRMEERLRAPLRDSASRRVEPGEAIATPGGREHFIHSVRRGLEYIRAGDVFQVVLSQPFEVRAHIPPVSLYRALRAVNPSPYLFLFDLGGPALVGSSPELLVKVERGHRDGAWDVVVRPIAGTRRRGATPAEDLANERTLRGDPKERAEHVMLVDLGRNDVGRVSDVGSVRVEDLMIVERYSHVMHLVSQVRGQLDAGKDALDAFAAAFPAGTLSGAPKIRAMQIIDELESARRGTYAGAVGAISFEGDLDFAITIRSARVTRDRVCLQAGAGIVADSDPAKEWDEVQAKIAAVLKAVQLAGGHP